MEIRNPNLKYEIIRQPGDMTELRKQVKETIKSTVEFKTA